MKLVLKNCPKETAQKLIQAFKIATAALNINNHAAEVHVTITPAEVTFLDDGHFRTVRANMGKTADRLIKGNIAEMQLSAFNTPQMVWTFLHELTHVAQMLWGDLKLVSGVDIWKGRRYRKPRTHEEYENLPWERQANEFAAKMYRRFHEVWSLPLRG